MQRLTFDPTLTDDTRTIDLDGVEYTYAYYWREWSQTWYLSLLTSAGAAVFRGRALRAGQIVDPDHTVAGHPGGRLVTHGPDGYTRSALGTTLNVYHLTADEWAALEAAQDIASTYTVTQP